MSESLMIGSVGVHLAHRVATLNAVRLPLTGAEFALLEKLVLARGAPVSREEISQDVLRRPWRAEDRSVDQLVFSLRRKLPTDEHGQPLVQSIRNVGYWIRRASEERAE